VPQDTPDPTAPDRGGADLPDRLPPPAEEEIRPDSFTVTTGFLRAGDAPIRLPVAAAGPPYTPEEADAVAHRFFGALAGDRELEHHIDDPVEHVRANGLMLLFSEGVQELFDTHLARMPEDHLARWQDLIAGGARSEAFGPLTLQERLDERQVEAALVTGRRQRIVNTVVGMAVMVALTAGGWFAYQEFGVEEARERGALQFASTDEDPADAAIVGGPPVAESALTVALADTVAVLAGDGPVADRITTAPFDAYPYPPGALAASLFQFAGSGHVVVVGPAGFVDRTCLRASVVTSSLRPLDTVTHGPCVTPVGRTPAVGCLGADAVLLALDIPAGQVDLPEGGVGFADAVRLQVVADDDPAYEVLSIRSTIEVDPESEVVIPRFGGQTGEELTFDLGGGKEGSCTLTGDLPGGR